MRRRYAAGRWPASLGKYPVAGGTITAEGDLDFRGTLGVARRPPSASGRSACASSSTPTPTPEQLATLLKLTARYCACSRRSPATPPFEASCERRAERVDEVWAGDVLLTFDRRVLEVFGFPGSESMRYHIRDVELSIDDPEPQGPPRRGAEAGHPRRRLRVQRAARGLARGRAVSRPRARGDPRAAPSQPALGGPCARGCAHDPHEHHHQRLDRYSSRYSGAGAPQPARFERRSGAAATEVARCPISTGIISGSSVRPPPRGAGGDAPRAVSRARPSRGSWNSSATCPLAGAEELADAPARRRIERLNATCACSPSGQASGSRTRATGSTPTSSSWRSRASGCRPPSLRRADRRGLPDRPAGRRRDLAR